MSHIKECHVHIFIIFVSTIVFRVLMSIAFVCCCSMLEGLKKWKDRWTHCNDPEKLWRLFFVLCLCEYFLLRSSHLASQFLIWWRIIAFVQFHHCCMGFPIQQTRAHTCHVFGFTYAWMHSVSVHIMPIIYIIPLLLHGISDAHNYAHMSLFLPMYGCKVSVFTACQSLLFLS